MSTGHAGEPQWIDNTADTQGQQKESDSGYAIILIQRTKSSGPEPRGISEVIHKNVIWRGPISTLVYSQDILAMFTALSTNLPQLVQAGSTHPRSPDRAGAAGRALCEAIQWGLARSTARNYGAWC